VKNTCTVVSNRSSEVPIDIEKYRAWPWQLLRDHRIEDGAGNAALNDNLPKPGRSSGLEVVVQGLRSPLISVNRSMSVAVTVRRISATSPI
jgi:hypothetical protein